MTAHLDQFFEIYPDLAGATQPLGVCVDGLVHAGALAGVDLVTGEPADGLEAQVTLALDHLRAAVEGAGGSLANVGRAVAHVARAEDRQAVYGPWDALFPHADDRPAFKVLVGSLPPGQHVRMDGLAVLGAGRRRTEIPGVPARDPTVRMGDWVFTSRVHGIGAGGDVPEDAEAEAMQNFENIAALLDLNGCTPADLVQITLFGNDRAHFDVAEAAYSRVFPDPATRPAMHRLVSPIVAKFRFSVEMIARKDAADPQTAFQEIYLAPDHRALPDGVRLGPLAVAPALTGADAATGETVPGGAEAQIEAACANMEAFIGSAGGSKADLARATFYLPDVDDRSTLNKVWSAHYPDAATRPPHKYAPARLAEGQEVRLQVLALPGAQRRTLEIPGLEHMDPMAMGALTGNLVTSSRIFGSHAFTGERAKDAAEGTALAFAHATTLLGQAGVDWSRLVQLTAFIGDADHRALVEREWRAHTARLAGAPRLNLVEIRWAGVGAPRIEIVALT